MLLNVLVELGAAVLPRDVSLAAAALRSGIRVLGGLPSKISQLLLSLCIKIRIQLGFLYGSRSVSGSGIEKDPALELESAFCSGSGSLLRMKTYLGPGYCQLVNKIRNFNSEKKIDNCTYQGE